MDKPKVIIDDSRTNLFCFQTLPPQTTRSKTASIDGTATNCSVFKHFPRKRMDKTKVIIDDGSLTNLFCFKTFPPQNHMCNKR